MADSVAATLTCYLHSSSCYLQKKKNQFCANGQPGLEWGWGRDFSAQKRILSPKEFRCLHLQRALLPSPTKQPLEYWHKDKEGAPVSDESRFLGFLQLPP